VADEELEVSDAELLARHVGGDAAAFAGLVRRHQDRLWAVALRTLGNRDEAADALQDGLLSAYRSAGSFRGDAAVTTWLHRIVVNACLDRIRRHRARPTVPLPTEGAEPPDPGDWVSTSELRVDLARALAVLSDEQRSAVVLVDIEGWSVEEAARVLGCAPGTVKSRCARARARMLPLVAHLRNPDAGHDVPFPDPSSVESSGTEGGEQRPWTTTHPQ
jgi:RNA polymerase sigma-70 factor, ECF subfamily